MRRTATLVAVLMLIGAGNVMAQRKPPKKPEWVSYVNVAGKEGALYLASIRHIIPMKDSTGIEFCIVPLVEGQRAIVAAASCEVVRQQHAKFRGVEMPKAPTKKAKGEVNPKP